MTHRQSVACRQLVELVTSYLEDALSPAQRVRVEQHLAACGNCRDYLAQMRRVIAVARNTMHAAPGAADALPPGMLDTLLSEFRRPKS